MLGALFAVILAQATQPAPTMPERVVVRSSNHSCFNSQQSRLWLERTGDEYVDGEWRIPAALVSKLIAAASAPAASQVPSEWLQREDQDLRATIRARASWSYPPLLVERVVEAVAAPANQDALAHAACAHLSNSTTHLEIHVELIYAGGRRVDLSSSSENPFMLPWLIDEGAKSSLSCDPALGVAIAQLLPEKFANRAELQGKSAGQEWGEFLPREIEAAFYAAEEKEVWAEVAPALRKRFTLVPDWHYSAFDYRGPNGRWVATLLSRTPGTGFDLTLSKRDFVLHDASAFLRDAGALDTRIRGIPWLRREMVHGRRVMIDYVDDQSPGTSREFYDSGLSARVSRSMAEAMIGAISFHIDKAEFLLLYDDRAIFLGGGTMPADFGRPLQVGQLVRPDGSTEAGTWRP